MEKEQDYDEYINSIKDTIENRRIRVENNKNKYSNLNKSDYSLQLINYLNEKTFISDEDYTLVTIYIGSGCHTCQEKILEFINHNVNVLNQTPLYIILTAHNASQLNKEIKVYSNLNEFENIILDTTGVVKNLNNTGILLNPRITIVKDNKISMDSIYAAIDIEKSFIPTLMKNLNLIAK